MNLKARWEGMAARERRLLMVAGGVFISMLTAVVVLLIADGLTSLEERNQGMREALAAIEKNRTKFMAAQRLAQQQESRISRVPLQLVTLVENAARQSDMIATQTTEQPPQPHGKKYLQKSVDLKFQKVDLIQLTSFMRRLETGPNLVYVSRLQVKTRFREHSELDVELTVTAFEHSKGNGGSAKTAKGPEGKKT